MNLMQRLDPLIHTGTWYWNAKGKLQRMLPPAMDINSNWIVSDLTFRCQKWHKIFWELLSGRTMVHSHCQECYKVVLIPRTFHELMLVKEYQEEFYDCKCGIDMREYTANIYGAYWYCRGLEKAQERYEHVVAWAEQHLCFELPDITIKRGCTEFEVQGYAGDSTKWRVSESQKYMETWLGKNLDFDPFINIGQTEDVRQKVRLKWMRWAHAHGDMTYISENGHLPLHPSCRVYHKEKS